jgi:hypothetical protein
MVQSIGRSHVTFGTATRACPAAASVTSGSRNRSTLGLETLVSLPFLVACLSPTTAPDVSQGRTSEVVLGEPQHLRVI